MPSLLPRVYNDPLDLLRRFVPTPISMRIRLRLIEILLQTNDESLATSLPVVEATVSDREFPTFLWKIVRDGDVLAELAEASIMVSGDVSVCTMGPACLIAADRTRKELLAFIGAAVSKRALHQVVLPFLTRLTEFASSKGEAPETIKNVEARTGE
jgi:hypothetical protein